MKPSFALNFTDSSIGLLHRTSRGWLEVGAVAFDEPDLRYGACISARLRPGAGTAGDHDQTRHTEQSDPLHDFACPGPRCSKPTCTDHGAALEGKTPYAVDELVFDWSGTGKTVQVAVVARETLEEAESFARENRFNPVSFVAIPEPGQFGGEPWFGPTAVAPSFLPRAKRSNATRTRSRSSVAPRRESLRNPHASRLGPAAIPASQPEPEAQSAAPSDVVHVAKTEDAAAEPVAETEQSVSPGQQSEPVSPAPSADRSEAALPAPIPSVSAPEPSPPVRGDRRRWRDRKRDPRTGGPSGRGFGRHPSDPARPDRRRRSRG